MLNDFLENNVRNKLCIISILHLKHSVSLKELSLELDLSISGLNSVINELNFELREIAEISKTSSSFKLYTSCNLQGFNHIAVLTFLNYE